MRTYAGASLPSSGRPDDDPGLVFISYSRKDAIWLDKVRLHIASVATKTSVAVFDDTTIEAGVEWHSRLDDAIRTAKVAILLVSPDFLASGFIRDTELPLLADAHRKGQLTILWLVVRPCLFLEHQLLSAVQAFSNPAVSLASLKDHEQDALLARLVREALSHASNKGVIARRASSSLQQAPAMVRNQLWDLTSADSEPARPRPKTPKASGFFPRAKQLPAIGVFFLGCEKIWTWVSAAIEWLSDEGRWKALLVFILVWAGVSAPLAVQARRRGRLVEHLGWQVLLFIVFGAGAVAGSTVLFDKYRRDATEAKAATSTLARLKSEQPAEFTSLENAWSQLSDEQKVDEPIAAVTINAKIAKGHHRDVSNDQVFVRAKFALDRSIWLTGLLAVLAVTVGAENVVCGLILAISWLND